MLTPRQRLQTVLAGRLPDCVPVAPDFSNMIPARLTGKPFWDLYLYNDPPIWEAYIACAKHFNIDSLMDGYFPLTFPQPAGAGPAWERFVVFRSPERIVVQASYVENGRRIWARHVSVYYVADPPTHGVLPEKIGLPPVPERWEPLEGVKPVDTGPEGFRRVKEMMGDQGLVGAFVISSNALVNPDGVYRYYDHPELHERWAAERIEQAERRFAQIMAMEVKPDFLCVGGSGTLVFQTVEIFRKIAFPAVKRVIELATAAGIPTHVHSCGPERELVRIFAEETNLTVIDPLEMPPMGDCNLAELKRLYGDRIVLKGNLHTTHTMLRGTPEEVAAASRRAIDDAAAGGKFILSTGDQCGRDTPFENLHAMIETARTYGRY
ncbi:MAG: uroporphyrinogen decarboxylase family protein [Armatimonadota bacterium]|nr:uroporphyrinogen decarboxylase family protein [Armatimonadota bacterium]